MFKSEISVYVKDFIDKKQRIWKFNTYINNINILWLKLL